MYRGNLYFSNTPDCTKTPSVFLAGPTIRNSPTITNWRMDAIEFIDPAVQIIIPEPDDLSDGWCNNRDFWWPNKTEQINWEIRNLKLATVILFWIPRNMTTLPGLTTNVEFGMCIESRPETVFVGYPEYSEKNEYLSYVYNSKTGRKCIHNLKELCETVNHFLLKDATFVIT